MRARLFLLMLVAIPIAHVASAEYRHPKADEVLAEYRAALAQHAAKLADEVAAAKLGYEREAQRSRDRALRDLKRLITSRSDVADQAMIHRAVLQLDRDDADARGFFGAIGTLESELAALGEEPAGPQAAAVVDLLAVGVQAPDRAALVLPVSEWEHQGVWHDSPTYPGLLLAAPNRPIRLELTMPGGPCYLHFRYAAPSPRPTQLWIGGQLAAEAIVGAATGGPQQKHLAWDTAGPFSPPAGTVAVELRCAQSSPHFRGVVVSRSAEPPAADPFAVD